MRKTTKGIITMPSSLVMHRSTLLVGLWFFVLTVAHFPQTFSARLKQAQEPLVRHNRFLTQETSEIKDAIPTSTFYREWNPLDPHSDPLGLDPASSAFSHQSRLSFVVMSDSPTASTEQPSGFADKGKVQRAFEVNRPTRILPDADHVRACSATLVQHSFTNSYGQPSISTYSPDLLDDEACRDPSRWVFIELGIEGHGKGRQFDRLGSIQLDGVEVLRTDNQEPGLNGTVWSFAKEMNKYFDLFRTKRTLLFDFPNIVNDVYISPLNMTLTFTVYVSAGEGCLLRPLAHNYSTILPLSKRDLSANSFFTLGDAYDHKPNDVGVTRLTIPRNTKAALVEVYASGTAQDEFWYTNLPNAQIDRLGGTSSNVGYPRGPLRELQIFIDGQLAGVALPFPVIFTGGISPFLWRPQVAFGAFDQPTYLIDVTPFVPTLTDDKEHEFALKVVSAEKNQTVLGWFVSGSLHLDLDPSDKRTTGEIIRHEASPTGAYDEISYEKGNVSEGGSIYAEVRTSRPRTVFIQSLIKPGSSAEAYTVTWSQSMTFSSINELQNDTTSTLQDAQGSALSTHGSEAFLSYRFSYPLNLTSVGSNYTLEHGYHMDLQVGPSVASAVTQPQSQTIDMTQNGEAQSIVGDNPQQLIGGYGTTFTSFHYQDTDGRTFSRDNRASNQTVTHDEVTGTLSFKAGAVTE